MTDGIYFQFQFLNADIKDKYLSKRDGEQRLGQKILFRDKSDSWTKCHFHILGVCEDIGPQMNGGFSGAKNAFFAFLPRFFGMQSNDFLKGDTIALHGTIALKIEDCSVSNEVVQDLDLLVTSWVSEVIENGGVPIVIGGGHNNAYGLMKGCAMANNQPIDVVNLDPHADTRALEGRHSGNPFSYAFEEGYLSKYTVLGLHESYNNQFILDKLKAMQANATFFESWIDDPTAFMNDVANVITHQKNKSIGMELDMDAIVGMPSSAYTPSGISVEQARYYVRKLSANLKIAYFHLPEAAPQNELENKIVGKTLSYLVTDFIKCQSNFLKKILS